MTGSWTWLWTTAIVLPLVTAAVLWAARFRSRTGPLTDTLTKYAALAVAPTVALALIGPRVGTVDAPWLLLGTHLHLDTVGRPLLLVAALLYGAALVATWSSQTERRATLAVFLLVSFVGNAGVFVAADAVTFYLAFAVMGFAAYGLVIHERTDGARRAGRIYLTLTLIAEMAVLWALLLTVHAGGRMLIDAPAAVAASDQRDLIIALLIVGFGLKAGMFPLHVWLPLAHPAAPPPGSAVLSGTMIKAGLVGWLRFLPLGEVALPGWGSLLVGMALLSAFLSVLPGVLQNDAKAALAYSSISQMGFLGILVGTALVAPELAEPCTLAAVVYAVHHGMAKGGLFLGVTVWRTHGYGWIRWWVLTGLALMAAAVAGAPFGSGAVAKYTSKEALGDSTFLWFSLATVLPFVATVSTMMLVRAGYLLLTGPRDRAWGMDGAVLSWTVLGVGGTVLTWYLAGQWAPAVTVPGLDTTALWDATWPVLLGLALAAGGWWLSRRGLLPDWVTRADPAIPAGDLIVPAERGVAAGTRTLQHTADAVSAANTAVLQRIRSGRGRLPVNTWTRGEHRIADWVGSGVAIAAVATTVVTIVIVVVVW
ncbi:complex I subunit 5 family protein [Mycolicibacterium thermoresistibile]